MREAMKYVVAATEIHQSQGDLVVCEGNALGRIVARFPRTIEGKQAADRFIANLSR